MRRRHFEELRPLCPVCLRQGMRHALRIASVFREADGIIVEAMLHCDNADCRREYPVLDGIPYLVADLRAYVSNQILALTQRDDLSADMESLLGDCCGPGSPWDGQRLQASSYGWDHYGEFDPTPDGHGQAGSVARVLGETTKLAPGLAGPVVDLGCGPGRSTFELAQRHEGLVLGIDLIPALLRCASGVLRHGRARYPRRRIGLVYDRADFPVHFPGSERVDFWACDAAALPFAPATFGAAVALNLLDCVPSPRDLLASVCAAVRPGGTALFTTPYDWSPAATPVEAWLGGHSQRGETRGAAEPLLRSLLTPGSHPQSLAGVGIVTENDDIAWQVRAHDRGIMTYRLHAVACRILEGDER